MSGHRDPGMSVVPVSAAATSISASEFWQDAKKRRLAHMNMHPWNPSPPCGYVDREVRSKLALEMGAVEQVLLSIRTSYNAFAPVNRLPPEIFTQIFGFLQLASPPRVAMYNPRAPGYRMGWLYVTHVCRQWRDIALEHSSMWSNILLDWGKHCTEEFLRRAGTTPITLMVVGLETKADVLDLTSTNQEQLFKILHSLRVAAPILEKVFLHNIFERWDDSIPTHLRTPLPVLPADLFDRSAPCLRHLDIMRFSFSWHTLAFESLVHLEIAQDARPPLTNTSPDSKLLDFGLCLRVLADMPVLETLKLHYAVPSFQPENAASYVHSLPTVTLSTLQNLDIKDHVFECALALKHIITLMLSPAKTRVACTLDPARGRGSMHILPWLISQVRAWSGSSIRSMEIREWHGGFRLTAWDGFSPKHQENPHLQIGTNWYQLVN
ncbi:hypothetical protein EVG20_g10623 [Dentipellis fragilis]|uniref:F-box domain-containing protein n=1 Tax=Dentipellis fragilis TaxID=205917 RepID=A0A4Y9XS98_9AGAM|nr:hypothetical protein EVG20_g10623 [Dentipellis fragilis]